MEMPSETEIVPNSSGYPPAAWTPFLTALASRSSDRLHGVISFQEDATPICGFAKSSSPMPTARSMPRAAALSRPSVTSRLRGLISVESVAPGASLGMGRMLRPDAPRPTRVSPHPDRPHHHHVGQAAHQLVPGAPVVEGAPDAAVASPEVEPRLVVVVGRHRVPHHSDEEALGQSVALPAPELLPGVTGVTGPPDAGRSARRVATTGALQREH